MTTASCVATNTSGITAAPNAPDGSVTDLRSYSVTDFPADAAILCRNTAPLLAFAMTLLRRHVPCHILGRDLEKGLLRTVDTVAKGGCVISEFTSRLEVYRERETRRAKTKAARAAVDDRCDALAAVAAGCFSLEDVRAVITKLFASGTGLTLSTVHKAKGLEWETVFILDRHLMPSRWADSPWEQQQERNIQYVAVTRAKLHLKYITSNSWKT